MQKIVALLLLTFFQVQISQAIASPSSIESQQAALGYRASGKVFRAAAERVVPSLVSIETYGGVGGRASRQAQATGLLKPGEGPTSGVIISPDGIIITSTYNFIRRPSIITVTLRDGTQHVAELLAQDDTRKLCLLKIKNVENLPVPEFKNPSDLQVGQWSVAVGIGYGTEQPVISAGIISAKNRIFGRAIQTDANLSPANYGGPLVDLHGKLIGICVPLSPGSQSTAAGSEWYDSGIGFAVPLYQASWLSQLQEGQSIRFGRLGIQPEAVPKKEFRPGVKILEVAENSPAANAGLKSEDVVLKVNEAEILDVVALQNELGRYVEGDTLRLTVQRSEEKMEISVQLASRSSQAVSASEAETTE